jgi:uncharacterized SAM-binding protein YcdF (DUF218 family)
VTRLLLVLGYSSRRPAGLHPVCAARVARAAGLARDDDLVVLSGTDVEVELMAAAWGSSQGAVSRDRALRTAESAVAAVRLAEEAGADEVVVVTSWWHRPRASLMVRLALRRRSVRVGDSGAPGPWSVFQLAREAVCFPLIPMHLALARRRERRRASAGPLREP